MLFDTKDVVSVSTQLSPEALITMLSAMVVNRLVSAPSAYMCELATGDSSGFLSIILLTYEISVLYDI